VKQIVSGICLKQKRPPSGHGHTPDRGLFYATFWISLSLIPTPRRFAGMMYSFRESGGLLVLSIHKRRGSVKGKINAFFVILDLSFERVYE
jgi:hypothetical protein